MRHATRDSGTPLARAVPPHGRDATALAAVAVRPAAGAPATSAAAGSRRSRPPPRSPTASPRAPAAPLCRAAASPPPPPPWPRAAPPPPPQPWPRACRACAQSPPARAPAHPHARHTTPITTTIKPHRHPHGTRAKPRPWACVCMARSPCRSTRAAPPCAPCGSPPPCAAAPACATPHRQTALHTWTRETGSARFVCSTPWRGRSLCRGEAAARPLRPPPLMAAGVGAGASPVGRVPAREPVLGTARVGGCLACWARPRGCRRPPRRRSGRWRS